MDKRRYWLIKSEPSDYSFQDLLNEPEQTSEWDGVRNYQARNNIRDEMKVGDGVLFYHSVVKPAAIVGTAVIVKEGYPDDTAWDSKSDHPDPKSTPENPIWYMMDIKAETEFSRAITLPQVKATAGLENMVLVKNSRLSVQPVTEEEWNIVHNLGVNGTN